MDHSKISSAFYRVGLVADQTWWTDSDYKDDYKSAHMRLWNDVIHSNEQLFHWGARLDHHPSKGESPRKGKNMAHEKPNTIGSHVVLKKDHLMPSYCVEVTHVQKALTMLDPTVPAPLPQSAFTDTRCILGANWPLTILKTYPALSNALQDPSRSVFSRKHARGATKDGNALAYSIDSVEELMYHRRLTGPSVKDIWAEDSESIVFNKDKDRGVWEPGLNANVPEFYPSVLLPPRQCPPRYSNIFGANYQSEVFPYNEEMASEKKESDVVRKKKSKKIQKRGTSEQRSSSPSRGFKFTKTTS